MSKVCELCGKSTMYGRNIRHHHATGWMFRAPRSQKTQKPNLRTAVIDVDGTPKKVKLCMKCYKSVTSKQSSK